MALQAHAAARRATIAVSHHDRLLHAGLAPGTRPARACAGLDAAARRGATRALRACSSAPAFCHALHREAAGDVTAAVPHVVREHWTADLAVELMTRSCTAA